MLANSSTSINDEPNKMDEDLDIKNSESQIFPQDKYTNDTKCGIACCYPNRLQFLASKKTYVVIYSLVGLSQFALSSYVVGTMSTLEKNFNWSSRMTGTMSAAWDVGNIFANIAVAYVASRGHRTRWIGYGMLLVSLTCFMKIIPYLLFGPGETAKMYTEEYSLNGSDFNEWLGNGTNVKKLSTNIKCNLTNSDTDTISYYIIVSSQVILGVGTAVFWTCGATYLDDNVRKNIVPMLLAIVQFIRMFGPTVGFLLSSWALRIYVDPYSTPVIKSDDPRWIGAWWLGWYPLGIANIVLASFLFLFPRILPRAAIRKQNDVNVIETTSKKSFSDFMKSIRRIMKNKIVVFNSLSSVCFVAGFAGYFTFMPKYFESQFRLTASSSSFVVGTVSIVSNALGILISGLFITKVKPSPRFLAGWNVVVEFLDFLGHVSYAFMGCPVQTYHGHWNNDHSWNTTETCNVDFKCGNDIQFAPVCDISRELVYYSSCHAGCTSSNMINGTMEYSGCSCVQDAGKVINGLCPTDCTFSFTLFITIRIILSFMSSTGRSANTLLQFRCVNEEDKALSIGITETLIGLLAFAPSPVFYGMIMDWACIVWGDNCGEKGNCWLYDPIRLRYVFNFTISAFLAAGTILDCFVWYYSKGLKIYDEDFDKTYGKVKGKLNIVESKVTGDNKDSIPLTIKSTARTDLKE